MGPVISIFLGLICGEVIFVLLIRAVVPKLPLPERWRWWLWRFGIGLAIVYGYMMIIVMLTMNSPS